MELGEARERIAKEHGLEHSSRAAEFNGCDHCKAILMMREMTNLVLDRAIANLWHGPDCLPITPRMSKRMQDRLYAINKLRALKEE